MKRFTTLILVSLLLLFTRISLAQVPSGISWHLAKEGSGIKVYTADAGASGRKYIKVNAEITSSLDKIKTVFRNIAQQKAWVYGTKQSYLIKKITDNHLQYYNETALPWPASNRDIAINMQMEEDANQHTLIITQTDIEGLVPVHKGIVRVPHMVANWRFHKVREQKLQAEYYLDIDPGGALPAWVINLFVAKGPYETFVKLQRLVN